MRTKGRILFLILLLGLSCSRKWDNPLESGGVAGNHPPSAPVSPAPANGATNQDTSLTLAWSCADPDTGDTLRYDVYFGMTNPPNTALSTSLSGTALVVHNLSLSTTYYWRVIAKDNHGAEAQGSVWSFATGSTPNNPPYAPSNPSPPNGAPGQALNLTLSWTGGDPDPGDTARYDVYFDTVNPPLVRVSQDQFPSSLVCNGLNPGTTYYWQIVSRDRRGRVVNGPVWAFATGNVPVGPALLLPADGALGVGVNPTFFLWRSVTLFQFPEIPVILPIPLPDPASVTLASASLAVMGISGVMNPPSSEVAARPAQVRRNNDSEVRPSSPSRRADVPPRPLVTSYQIQVATDTGFGSRVVDQGGLADTSFSTNVLTNATAYFWRVRGTNDYGTGPWSGRFTFMTNRPPYPPGSPSPPDSATNQPTSLTLSWAGGDPDPGDTAKYDVFFDTVNPPVQQVSSNQLGTTFPRSGLANNTTYYWMIVARDRQGLVTNGPVWRFTTVWVNNPPNAPFNPYPPDTSRDITLNPILSWSCTDPDPGDTLRYDVYFDSLYPPNTRVSTNQSDTTLSRSGLVRSKFYFWKVIAKDNHGDTTVGPIWRFTTFGSPWDTVAPVPTPRYFMGVAEVLGKIYVIGGYNNGYLDTVEIYDPGSNLWSRGRHMPTKRSHFGMAVVNNKIYVFGGFDSSLLSVVEEYDPVADSWTTKAPLPSPRYGISAGAVNNKVYVVGGYNGSVVIDSVEEYDPSSNLWSTKASMNLSREYLSVASVNGKLYAIGGTNGSANGDEVEEYDPSLNTWVLKRSMPTTRYGHTSSVVNGKIYCFGWDPPVVEYDPSTNTWKTNTSMPTSRWALGSAVYNNKIYTVAGAINLNPQSIVERYNPALDP